MGLAPIGTKVDDEIWLLSSAEAFSILRPMGGGRNHYVGKCYLHCLMDGKVMEDLVQKNRRDETGMAEWFSSEGKLEGLHCLHCSRDIIIKVASTGFIRPRRGFTFGTDATIKTFYEKPGQGWVKTSPKSLSKKYSEANDRVAIKVCKDQDPENPVIATRNHEILLR